MRYLLMLSIVFTQVVFAQTKSITCNSLNANFSFTFEFDEKKNLITYAGEQMQGLINKDAVIFMISIDGINYYHNLNRNSGLMSVSNKSTSRIVDTLRCAQSQQKF